MESWGRRSTWWRVTKVWYVEAETAGDAFPATKDVAWVDAQALRIEGAECCDGAGVDAWGRPCANPRCPVPAEPGD